LHSLFYVLSVGQKFRFGGTFGHSTENALKMSKSLTISV